MLAASLFRHALKIRFHDKIDQTVPASWLTLRYAAERLENTGAELPPMARWQRCRDQRCPRRAGGQVVPFSTGRGTRHMAADHRKVATNSERTVAEEEQKTLN